MKTKYANCRKCKLPISFIRREGKLYPVNLDGSSHWDSCKRERNKGKVFKPIASKWFIGENYVETNCDCLPWDGCGKCGFPDLPLEPEQIEHIRYILSGED